MKEVAVMTVSFEFAEADRLLRMTFEGELTDPILLDAWRQAIKIATAFPRCRNIVDLSRISLLGISNDVIVTLARTRPVWSDDPLQVFVAPTDAVFGVSRMFQILSEQTRSNLRVVHTMDEAYKLLGVESPQFVPISTS